MEIERLFEIAMKDIEIQSKTKSDLIREKASSYDEHRRCTEQALDMIGLRIKKQPMQKFVQDYVSTMKEGEEVLNKDLRVTSNFEENVLDLRVKAPFFNYVISQRDHKGELMGVGLVPKRHKSREKSKIDNDKIEIKVETVEKKQNQNEVIHL